MLWRCCLLLVLSGIASTQGPSEPCLEDVDDMWKIQWPATAANSTQSVGCPGEGNTTGMANRRCLANGVWEEDVNVTECESVAVIEVGDQPQSPLSQATTISYYFACSISLVCVLASIIFFMTLGRELIRKLDNFIHLNLCIALFFGLLLFLSGLHTATAHIIACKVVTALLHYFFLATFTWTLCEAVLVFILLIKVFGATDQRWIILYLVLGWALPIPVVLITGGVGHDHYLIRHSFDSNHAHYEYIKACWLPNENGMIYAFIGPVLAFVVVDALLLTSTLVSLNKPHYGIVSQVKKFKMREIHMEAAKYLMKANIILVPLLAFTWITGLFAVGGDEGEVSVYLFVVANVLQGLLILLVLVVGHDKVLGKIMSKLGIRRKVILDNGASSAAEAKWIESNEKSSHEVGKRSTIVVFEGKKKDEDEMSIKDEGDMEANINIIHM